ncbi:MAG: hypothetical protein ACK4TP_10125 [Hyphomicrobium sp.]
MTDIYAGLGWRWWRWRDRLAQPFRLLKSLIGEWRAPLIIVRCDDCGHYFDAADRRGCVHETPEDDRRFGKTCPACWQEQHGGAEGWALWNSCQGVFTDAVTHTKAEAEARWAELGWGDVIDKVVPVRIHVEHEDNVWRREMAEREREAAA